MTDPSHLIKRLENLLVNGFFAKGADLKAKLKNIGGELPDDMHELLLNLSNEALVLGDSLDSWDFAFRCGQTYERLENLASSRLAASIAFHTEDGMPNSPDLEALDLDAIGRFVVLRDQILKTVADYTLKFLLVTVILLVIGLSLGLI